MQSGEIPPRLNPPTRTACECHCRWRRLYHGGWHIAFFARISTVGDGTRRRHDRATARSLFLHPRWLTSLLRESILKGSSMSKALLSSHEYRRQTERRRMIGPTLDRPERPRAVGRYGRRASRPVAGAFVPYRYV